GSAARLRDIFRTRAMQHLLVVGFGFLISSARSKEPAVQFRVFESEKHLTGLNMIALEYLHFCDAPSHFGANVDIASLKCAGGGKRIIAAEPRSHPQACERDSHYSDNCCPAAFHNHFSLSLRAEFSRAAGTAIASAAIPRQKISNVLSSHLFRSLRELIAQRALVPKIACCRMRANSVGGRSLRISPSSCPRAMMVPIWPRPFS